MSLAGSKVNWYFETLSQNVYAFYSLEKEMSSSGLSALLIKAGPPTTARAYIQYGGVRGGGPKAFRALPWQIKHGFHVTVHHDSTA